MTKLLEWLSVGLVLGSVWAFLLFGDAVSLDPDARQHVLLAPIYAVLAIGFVSFIIVVYRTATFNDCPEAAEELKRQIEEAKKDLAAKGFKFPSDQAQAK